MSEPGDPDGEAQTTRVSRKGQTTIPKEIRQRYGIEPGDTVEWIDAGDGAKVRRHTESTTKGIAFGEDVSDEDREEWVEAANERLKEKRRAEWNGTE